MPVVIAPPPRVYRPDLARPADLWIDRVQLKALLRSRSAPSTTIHGRPLRSHTPDAVDGADVRRAARLVSVLSGGDESCAFTVWAVPGVGRVTTYVTREKLAELERTRRDVEVDDHAEVIQLALL